MTEKLYDTAPYATTFEATVVACHGNEDGTYKLVLDRTLFFPEEGGQSPDKGTLSAAATATDKGTLSAAVTATDKGTLCPAAIIDDSASSSPENQGACISVLDVQIDSSNTITHTTDSYIAPGTIVTGNIDWQHRFSNMQQHTGEHIFSGLVNKYFGYDNVGFHLSDNEVTMDYNGALTEEYLLKIEAEANEAIIKNIKTDCRYPSAEELKNIDYRSKKEIEGAIRIVTIPGYDTCACCAPHVAYTGEIGLLKVVNYQAHRGGCRIWILCGFRALAEFNKLQEACAVVSQEYSAPVSADAFSDAIFKRNVAGQKMRERISELQGALLDMQLKEIDPSAENVTLFVEGIDEVKKRNVLNDLVKSHSGYCSVFDGSDENGYSFIIASSTLDCNVRVKELREKFGAKGGGKPVMVQGSVKTVKENLMS